MALATITTRTLAAGFTQTQLYNELRAAMVVAGFGSPISETGVAGSNMIMVFSYNYNGLTFGTAFLQVTVSSALTVTNAVGTAYNSGTNTLANASISSNFTLTNGSAVNTITVSNPEARGILISGSTQGQILLIRPESKPNWWDESLWPYFFLSTSVATSGLTAYRLRTCALTPIAANTTNAYFGPNLDGGTIGSVNVTTGVTEIFTWGIATGRTTGNFTNYIGKFSDDLGIAQPVGKVFGDTFSNQWVNSGVSLVFRYA